ncbi:MAG: HepT-like ribonuclease domain-containing protein [Bacillota bacterium]
MLEAIAAIERHLHRGKAAFEQDELLQGWFVRNLQIIGEAAWGLPEEVRALAPEIEWPKIIGMRNVLVHGYFDIDTGIVWEAASRDAMALRPRIGQLLLRLEGKA